MKPAGAPRSRARPHEHLFPSLPGFPPQHRNPPSGRPCLLGSPGTAGPNGEWVTQLALADRAGPIAVTPNRQTTSEQKPDRDHIGWAQVAGRRVANWRRK